MHLRHANRPAGHCRRGLARNESGVVAIEFALTLPLILLVLYAIIQFGQVFNALNDANQLAANGARYAAVNSKPPPSPPAADGTFQSNLGSHADMSWLRSSLKVCVEFPNGPTVGNPVKVSTSAPFTLIPLLGGAITIHGEATMRIERDVTFAGGC